MLYFQVVCNFWRNAYARLLDNEFLMFSSRSQKMCLCVCCCFWSFVTCSSRGQIQQYIVGVRSSETLNLGVKKHSSNRATITWWVEHSNICTRYSSEIATTDTRPRYGTRSPRGVTRERGHPVRQLTPSDLRTALTYRTQTTWNLGPAIVFF